MHGWRLTTAFTDHQHCHKLFHSTMNLEQGTSAIYEHPVIGFSYIILSSDSLDKAEVSAQSLCIYSIELFSITRIQCLQAIGIMHHWLCLSHLPGWMFANTRGQQKFFVKYQTELADYSVFKQVEWGRMFCHHSVLLQVLVTIQYSQRQQLC